METSLFDFHLPQSLIAQEPLKQRDASRLLYVSVDSFIDRHFSDLPDILTKEDVLVFNNSKVIPARLFGKRDDISVEILLHKPIGHLCWKVFARPAKRLKKSQLIYFGHNFTAEVLEKCDSGEVILAFHCLDEADFYQKLISYGHMPLPPYIKRQETDEEEDKIRYQTIYAEHAGSVAAPTAGLHFTDILLQRLQKNEIEMEYITLHVGGGTFLPVKAEKTEDHIMHSEYGELTEDVAERLNQAKRNGKRIVAVGTTSMRILESAAVEPGRVQPFRRETDIFITPGYRFNMVDRLITNFHLPKSTLFMLVSAFTGLNRMKTAYTYAVSRNYRFYSYGDASLLEKCPYDL